MNIKRLLIGTIVGGVLIFLLGYLIWEVIFAGFFEANQMPAAAALDRETILIWAEVLGALAYALLITLGLERGSGGATLVDGLKVGAVVGFLLWFTADFTLYSLRETSTLTAVIADPLLEGVRGALGGLAIVLSRKLSG
jgi:hypothetical protein